MELRIKEILADRGIKISTFATEVGITQANMSNIVNGKSKPSLKSLQKIAEVLKVEFWELFTSSTSKEELTALISHKGDFYKASTIEELKKIVEKIKQK